jgi:glycerophosphoryl diester phosphodiesterase
MKFNTWLLALILCLVLAVFSGACGDDDSSSEASAKDDDDDNDGGEVNDDINDDLNDDVDDDVDDDSDDDADDDIDDDVDDDVDDDCDAPLYPDVLVTAHRGATAYAPENTIPTIEKAFELGAFAVEIDVRHTSDGEYVLMHDDTVDRTTNGSGLVSEMTLEEIKALNVNALNPVYADLQVPTLAEALEAINNAGGQVDMDMKTGEPEGAIQVVVDMGLEDICFVYSSSVDKLDRVRSVSGDVRIMPVSSSAGDTQFLLDYFDPDPEHIELSSGGLTTGNIELIKSTGAVVFMDALGVRDVMFILGLDWGWKNMMEMGVEIIQTDMPGLLAEYRDNLCE